MAAKVGMDRKDLDALERAFKRFRVRLPEAAEDELGRIVKDQAGDARILLNKRPGASGKYKREPEAITSGERAGAPSINLQGGGTMIGAEYGANYHHVFGNRVLAKSMKRRVFGVRTRKNLGKVVGKTVTMQLPKTERRIAIAFDKSAEREFRREGI